jgi:hypothetical protein
MLGTAIPICDSSCSRLRHVGKAFVKAADPLVFSARSNALVDVEEHRQGTVPGPPLADHDIDTLAQPPRAGGMA